MNASFLKKSTLTISLLLAASGWCWTWCDGTYAWNYELVDGRTNEAQLTVNAVLPCPTGFFTINTNVSDFVVTKIGEGAFANYAGLTDVVIPSTVYHIGDRAFANCVNLTNITIPASVKSIGSSVFKDCTSLKSVIFQGDTPDLVRLVVGGGNSEKGKQTEKDDDDRGTNIDERLATLEKRIEELYAMQEKYKAKGEEKESKLLNPSPLEKMSPLERIRARHAIRARGVEQMKTANTKTNGTDANVTSLSSPLERMRARRATRTRGTEQKKTTNTETNATDTTSLGGTSPFARSRARAAKRFVSRMQCERRMKTQVRLETLATADVHRMTDEERENHERLLKLLVERDEIHEQIDQHTFEENKDNYEELHKVSNEIVQREADERKTLLSHAITDLGFSGHDVERIIDTITVIYDVTELPQRFVISPFVNNNETNKSPSSVRISLD